MNLPDPILIDIPEWIACPRVILAAPVAGAGAAMAAAITESIAHLKPWMPWAQEAPSPESAELVMRRMQADFILRRDLVFQIYARTASGERGELLGGTGLHRIDWALRRFEIGFWIRASAEGQGYVSEAVRAMAALAFDQLAARRVEIRMDARNVRSRAVAERCGFELEGVMRRDAMDVAGELRDTRVYSRLA